MAAIALSLPGLRADTLPEYQVRHWLVEDGLPDDTVTALAQTPDGYLWVGTGKGLVRFDGDSFKLMEPAAGQPPQNLPVISLLTDARGGLWVASQSGQVARFAAGKFATCCESAEETREPGTNNPSAWNKIKSVLAQDAQGDVWVLTIRGELLRFPPAGPGLPATLNGLPAGDFRGLANDESGRIWLLKGTNACVFFQGRWHFSPDCGVPLSGHLLGPAGATGFFATTVSNTCVQAYALDCALDGGWKSVARSIPTSPAYPQVTAMFQQHDGRVWLAQQWSGIYASLPGKGWNHVHTAGPLARCTTSCLISNRQGGLWIGTHDQGLFELQEPAIKMVLLPPAAADANLHLTTIAAARDGGFWAGTDEALYHGRLGEPWLENPVTGLTGENIFSVLEDEHTNLWVGTRTGLYERADGQLKRVVSLPDNSVGILALYEDRRGRIWATGPPGLVLHQTDADKGAAFAAVNCPPTSRLGGFTEDAQGRIWVAPRNTRIWRVDGNTLVPDGPPPRALAASVRALVFDPEGALWIGTLGAGVYRWSSLGLQHYTTEDGLPNNSVLGLAVDGLGNLWITSHNGIIGCSRRQLANYVRGKSPPLLCQHLGLDEGLPDATCSGSGQPVIEQESDGWFWAATMSGAAGFDPRRLPGPTGKVNIETLRLDGLAVRPADGKIRAPASIRRFEFQYSAPELRVPKSLRFRYRLDGLDADWVEAGSSRVASYSQLPPGNYKFRVMVGGGGHWREAEMPAALEVVPRFWQTVWFHTLGITSAVGILAGLVSWNERRKFRQRMERFKARQAMEQMRHRIARDLHDELGSSITEIIQLGDLTRQAGLAPERLQAGVTRMTGRLRQLGVKLDEIVWTMSSRNDTLPNLAGYISNYAQEFFHHSGVRCRLDVTRNLPEVTVDSQTRHNLFLAVKEALNNVAKHAGAAEVMVRVYYTDDLLSVAIEDDGRGFETGRVRKGEGLASMKDRLEAIHGRTEITSRPGAGTSVLFTLALAPPTVPDRPASTFLRMFRHR